MKVYLRFFPLSPILFQFSLILAFIPIFPITLNLWSSCIWMLANPYSRFRFPFHFNVYLMVILFSEGRQRRVSRQAVEELSHHLGQRVGTRYNKIFLPMPCLNLEIEIMPEKCVKKMRYGNFLEITSSEYAKRWWSNSQAPRMLQG